MERLQRELPEEFKKVRVLWTSPMIPNDPLIYRTDLSDSMKGKLEKFFLSYGKGGAHQQKVLDEILKLSGFRKSSNAQLIPIADLELFSQLRKNQDDEKKSPAEKQKAADGPHAQRGKIILHHTARVALRQRGPASCPVGTAPAVARHPPPAA